jgi:hypothetical protein
MLGIYFRSGDELFHQWNCDNEEASIQSLVRDCPYGTFVAQDINGRIVARRVGRSVYRWDSERREYVLIEENRV